MSGTAALRLLWDRELDASCKVFCARGDALVEAPRAAIVCSRAQCAELRVHAPAAGEWGLELYASASGERTQELVWRGVLLADRASALSAAVGALDGHQVGPLTALAALPLALDAPLEPLLHVTEPELSIALSVRQEQPVHVQCSLRGADLSGAAAGERELEPFVFKQSDAQRVCALNACASSNAEPSIPLLSRCRWSSRCASSSRACSSCSCTQSSPPTNETCFPTFTTI